MPYSIYSGENLLIKFSLFELTDGLVWRGIYDSGTAYVVDDALLGTDNIGYVVTSPVTGIPPPNVLYYDELPAIPVASIKSIVAEIVDSDKKVVVTWTYTLGGGQAGGLLVVGNRYVISDFHAGDDFTNVGAASNATGVIFVASGTTPTTWSNNSVLQQMIAPANMFLEEGMLTMELMKADTEQLDGLYELRVKLSVADGIYIQSGAQTDVLCLPDSIQITPC